MPATGEPILSVGVTERIDPAHAPRPTNEGERLLFRQLYETLIRVNCLGRAVPGLAASWRLDADGRTWLVTLDGNARFTDGTPVTAHDVHASWRRGGGGDELQPHVSRLVQAVAVISDRELAIVLQRYRPDAPMALAHQDLAVVKPNPGSGWPIGTRAWRPTFLIAPGDPRDLLDQGPDLLLTRDPAALDYASTLPRFHTVALPWQRTHVLIAPGRPLSSASPLPEARRLLADSAVRGEARAAEGPFWWETAMDCDTVSSPAPRQSSPAPRVVYDANDGAARDLAQRLVGLRMYPRAMGLSSDAMAIALRRGTDAAYVVTVPSRPLEPCYELQAILDAIPWFDPRTVVPLVETRLQAIVRRGASGVIIEGDGGLLLTGTPAPNPQ